MSLYIDTDFRFGSKPSTVTSYTVIWPVTTIPAPAIRGLNSADYAQIASTSATDTASGAGSRRVVITGLTSSLEQVREAVWLNGTTPTTTANQYISVYRMYNDRGNVNVGSIFCGYGTFTSGVPASIISQMNAGFGQTTQLTGFIPFGTEVIINEFEFSLGRTGGGQDVLGEFRIRSRHIRTELNLYEFEPWRVRFVGASISDLRYTGGLNGFRIRGPAEIECDVLTSADGARASGALSYTLMRALDNGDYGN